MDEPEFSFYEFVENSDVSFYNTAINPDAYELLLDMDKFYEDDYRYMVCAFGWISDRRRDTRIAYKYEPSDQYLITSMFCSH